MSCRGLTLTLTGLLVGAVVATGGGLGLATPVSAQQAAAQPARPPALPTVESLPSEVAQLKALVPSNSHIMMDVQFHWVNLWFAGQRKNWPLALYYFNESRGHIQWLIRKSPTTRGTDGTDVDIKSIFDAVDTSSLAAVKTAIEAKSSVQFAATYKTMLESCYACHKSVGRPYLRPMVPLNAGQMIINPDPNATWPQ